MEEGESMESRSRKTMRERNIRGGCQGQRWGRTAGPIKQSTYRQEGRRSGGRGGARVSPRGRKGGDGRRIGLDWEERSRGCVDVGAESGLRRREEVACNSIQLPKLWQIRGFGWVPRF
jgi:hypothetical protein